MTLAEFQASLGGSGPPQLTLALKALWYDARGDWHSAHEAAQEDSGTEGAWVHAYLHRKEGDISNAGYWYRRAGKPPVSSEVSLQREWEQIAAALLES